MLPSATAPHVLIVKISSLGDVIHTLPALTDAAAALPGLTCDWVVEEAFAAVPGWHPAVHRVIPLALRRWRQQWRRALVGVAGRPGELGTALGQLRAQSYHRVIDAQGLLKSAVPAVLARGPSSGLDFRSAREPWVSWSYRQRVAVPQGLHAIERVRRLFAAALGYAPPVTAPDYGIRAPRPAETLSPEPPYVVLLHATTWPAKHWPEAYWVGLARRAAAQGYRVLLPWHAPQQRLAAARILEAAGVGELLPRADLGGIAAWLAGAAGVVGVDTGLAHLAAALGVPAVTLYGATDPQLTATLGLRQCCLAAQFPCAPCRGRQCSFIGAAPVHPACYASLPPEVVWEALRERMASPGEPA